MTRKLKKQLGVGGFKTSPNQKKYVNQVLKSNRFSYGHFLNAFEEKFAKLHNRKYAISCNSGTSALQIALATLKEIGKWKDGDEVIVPATTFIATSNIVLQNNLRPIFVDVDSKFYNIDCDKIEDKITKRTRAIIPVHLFGLSAEMSRIMEIAKKHNLKVIEDSCEAMFVKYKNKPVGSMGDIACFSTYVAHLITTGVGGILTTNNKKYAIISKSIMNHGRDSIYISMDDDKVGNQKVLWNIINRRFRFVRMGYSYRLTEMEGALGLGELEKKDKMLNARRRNAAHLIKNLSRFRKYFQLPVWPKYSEHAFMMFPIVIINKRIKRNKLINFLEQYNIETRYMMPLLNQPIYKKIFGNDIENKYPVAKNINQNGFYIGCHPGLTRQNLNYMVKIFELYFQNEKLLEK